MNSVLERIKIVDKDDRNHVLQNGNEVEIYTQRASSRLRGDKTLHLEGTLAIYNLYPGLETVSVKVTHYRIIFSHCSCKSYCKSLRTLSNDSEQSWIRSSECECVGE